MRLDEFFANPDTLKRCSAPSGVSMATSSPIDKSSMSLAFSVSAASLSLRGKPPSAIMPAKISVNRVPSVPQISVSVPFSVYPCSPS